MKDISKLLKENRLSHYKYDEEKSRVVYDHDSSPFVQKEDFKRLISTLKNNNIRYDDFGIDMILIEQD